MYTQSHSQRISGLAAATVWQVWTDVDRWTEWQEDLESARLDGEFRAGGTFTLRPKGGPNVKVELTEVVANSRYTDVTRFPLAEMTGVHAIIVHGRELELKTTISVTGPLAFLWTRLVAKGVVAGLPEQTRRLVARTLKGEAVAA